MATRIVRYTSKPHRGFLQVCAEWQLITAISITTVILALNISLPNLSNPSSQSLSTYQTRIPTIQYRTPIPKFIYLSYLNPVNGLYFKGNDDIYFVCFWALVWLTLRELSIQFIWTPVGAWFGLRKKSSKLVRFAEQGWTLSYATVFWSIGVKTLSEYPDPIYTLNIRQYWADHPRDSIPGLTKFYYLSQAAFWIQQIITLNLEKPRKDHYQMLAHHLVACLLVCSSYAVNFTGIGLAIHTTMDFSDILLCMAKMLNYLGGGWACDGMFTLFVLSWIGTRHIVFPKIIWSIYAELPSDIPWIWDPPEGRFAATSFWIGFLVLLCFLELLLIFWLWLILRIMWGVIVGNGAEDERSDIDENEIEVRDIMENDEHKDDSIEDEKKPLLINTPQLESLGEKLPRCENDEDRLKQK
ncbi:sphingosine N-acyltransferase lag1 [Puccinia graminis f. sp. tritici]|uniref:TLC domain-containing protein n=2 Tax=Puccinia graminis f. sp. tritici TaxID=56615 RepID=E3KGV3_PUCGT|nr:uncharacterized protein PGTG_08714 [Puccinia graminis f. sp. tritici CRL 75-36-700-3]KAA1066783.1 sphingosine N-acyltransferase lag1 [Puccinia graminis f. sp. tritici]EFP83528.2 hypothetical protein PGTG_08714 [Puccinia graminis f. sp. tritici CRL 75-36-700-3]KAA1071987.1 sphingosine N-acyltransferase lag1 [Puccinia graminis f. sp. tritici]KAA1078011.1 sphingosine N-acyltransferase lag1 [Puccinia graminis f. sp. tritici]KAA1103688.1 sphingosine N-acyltransferase lag1 [Puccinia graminis f. s